MIINPKSISFKEIRDDLTSYLNSQPDAAQWSLFLQSNAGSNLIDIVAGLGAFLKMETITARRENFIQFAQNRSSVIGHAQFLGYSAYRGRNKVLKLTIVPNTTEVLYKYSYIGVVRDRYLVVANDTVVNAGVPVQVEVIVGEVLEETKIAPNTALNSFRFTQSGVSQDCRIYIDDVELEWSDSVEEMLHGKFAIQSNSFGSVDAKYLNLGSFLHRYMGGSLIKLQWINLKDVDFDDTEVKLYEEYGTLIGQDTLSVFEGVEDLTSIAVNAPLKNETANAVRGREDQPKIFRSLHPDIIDAQGQDVTPAVMKIYLLREGHVAFTPDEKLAMQKAFEPKRPHGLFPPIIEDAEASPVELDITLTLKKNSTTVPTALVESTLAPYKDKLGTVILLSDIEDILTDDVGVKIARVKIAAAAWIASTMYRLGSYVRKPSDNGKVYRVLSLKNKAGSVEPTWPIVDKAQVTDHEIVWKAVPKSDLAGYLAWEADAHYGIGASVKPSSANGFVYECVDVLYHCGTTEPIWPVVDGAEVFDGRIIWKARAIEGTVPAWTASTSFKKGDVVKQTTGTVTLMFQCVGFLGSSGASQPAFSLVQDATFDDSDIVWLTQDPTQDEHKVEKNQYFVITPNLTVV